MKNITRLADAPAPEHWKWAVTPNARNTGGILSMQEPPRYHRPSHWYKAMDALRKWVVEYDLGLKRYNTGYVETSDGGLLINVTDAFRVTPEDHERTMTSVFADVICPYCGHKNKPNRVVCAGCAEGFYCAGCASGGAPMVKDGEQQNMWGRVPLYCLICAGVCRKCGNGCDPNWATCSGCERRARCGGCRKNITGDAIHDVEFYAQRRPDNTPMGVCQNKTFCDVCVKRLCENCFAFVRGGELPHEVEGVGKVCRHCYAKFFDEYRDAKEEFDSEELTSDALVIPITDGRAHIRDVGIEIEGGGDGEDLARHLYRQKLVPRPAILGYHAGSAGFPAVITRDASVDWEMVIDRFNPSDNDAVGRVHTVLKAVREKIKDGTCHLDLRCGCHIHVDAHKIGMKDARNLHGLWCYLEDPIFRIGSSHWSTHRSFRHGAENGAAQPHIKKKFKTNQEFGYEMDRGMAGRYYALSFANFWNAMHGGACVCGAIRYGEWAECTCNLGKCTFEFRVFNSTLNPRKVHAYVALAQALVAKAIELPAGSTEEFESCAWSGKPTKSMKPNEVETLMEAWSPRLKWMFTELPLTPDEKNSLAYCVRNSDLKILGDPFINELTERSVQFKSVAA